LTTGHAVQSVHGSGAAGDVRERVRAALKGQRQKTVTVLSSLLAVQDALHYIPQEAVEETAVFCNASVNDVWSVASFYTNFRFTPPGDHVVDVCWGPSCHILGAQKVLQAVQKRIGLDKEGETADRKLTLRYNTCLGACAQGPCIAVDHHVTGRVTPQSAADMIGRLAGR
jgi:NADH-quinone oxidoreductase subunit E